MFAMSSSTKTIVEITDSSKTDVFFLRKIVKEAIEECKFQNRNRFGQLVSSVASLDFSLEDGYFIATFKIINRGGCEIWRKLFVFLNCNCDAKHLCENSVTFSIGDDPEGQMLLKKIADKMKGHDGRVWYQESNLFEDKEVLV